MKIAIELKENVIKLINENPDTYHSILYDAIRNGTILSEEHVELKEAFQKIKNICKRHKRCKDCPFYNKDSLSLNDMCRIRDKNPAEWNIDLLFCYLESEG